ncbi:hypothetical protein P780_12405 [Vibrio mimicus CAIM 1882]|nr:hypothetical protein P780_12405 [Vibrio mimicus CAIM 1882]
MNGLPHQIALQRIFALHSSQPFIMDAGGSGCRKRPLILLDGVTQVTPIPCRNVLFFVTSNCQKPMAFVNKMIAILELKVRCLCQKLVGTKPASSNREYQHGFAASRQ